MKIPLPDIDLSRYSIDEQGDKVNEEMRELEKEIGIQASQGNNEQRIAEEALDVIQASLGLLKMLTMVNIKAVVQAHWGKIKGRGWRISGRSEVGS